MEPQESQDVPAPQEPQEVPESQERPNPPRRPRPPGRTPAPQQPDAPAADAAPETFREFIAEVDCIYEGRYVAAGTRVIAAAESIPHFRTA